MKKSIIFCLLFAVGLFTQAQDTTTVTLEEALSNAREHNASLKNAELDVKYSEQTVKSIVATGLPQVNANASFVHNIQIAAQQLPDFLSPAIYGVLMQEGLIPSGPFPVGDPQEVQFGAPSMMTGSVSMRQLVFDGTFFLGLKAAKQYVNMSELLKQKKDVDVTADVTKSFYGVLIAEENYNLVVNNLRTVEKSLRDIQQMYEAGLVEKLDVDRLKLTRSTLATQVNNLKGQRDIMKMVFKLSIGMPVETPIKLNGDLEQFKNGHGMLRAEQFNIENRVEFDILNQQITLDSLNVRRYKVGYIPNLYLNVSHQQNSFASQAEFVDLGKTWYPGTTYSLNLSVPIFDGLYKKAKISEARIKLEQDRNTLNNTRNAIYTEVAQAELRYATTANAFNNEKESRELAREIYRVAEIKFREGVGSSMELAQAESDKTQAEIRYSNALYEFMVAVTELQMALGTL